MKAAHPTLPVTEVLAIERSEHKTEVFGLLCSGVSPARTATLILQRYGEVLPIEAVAEFATAIPAEYFLSPGELQKRVNFIDVEIDTIGEMATILRFMKGEVELSLTTLRVTGGNGTVTADTRKLVYQYWGMLKKFEELRGELGLVPVAQQKAPAPVEDTLPSLRTLMIQHNVILPGQAAQAVKAAFVEGEVKVLSEAVTEGS